MMRFCVCIFITVFYEIPFDYALNAKIATGSVFDLIPLSLTVPA